MHTSTIPAPDTFTPAPLRNRIRIRLDAPVAQVWSLIGDFTRFPEYSAGLARVDQVLDADGRPLEYVCHFRPQSDGEDGVEHREIVRWYEPERGYASSGEAANAFGLSNDVNYVTVEADGGATVVTWEERFDAVDVEKLRASYDEALADIAARLIARFGGRVL